MKLSKETLSIIKNFGAINPNLTLKAGSELATISSGKNIIAKATVKESFPEDFGIYDVNEFLGAMSLFDDPELTFTDKFVTIKENSNGIKYFAANQSVLTNVPSIKPFPEPDITFDLTSNNLSQILRVSSILRVTDFSVVGDGTNITVLVGDKNNPTGNTFESIIGSTDKTFKINFKVENLKMLPGDYEVSIGAKKISRFINKNVALTYFIALELDSTFDF